jgi:hypothetical protein
MKSEVCRSKSDTGDELLHHIMDVVARIKERQFALKQDATLQSALVLTAEFSEIYYTVPTLTLGQ